MLSAAIVIGASWANFGPIIDSQLILKKISYNQNSEKNSFNCYFYPPVFHG